MKNGKFKKKRTCAWRVTTKTCLESEYIKNIKTIYLSISMYMGPPPPHLYPHCYNYYCYYYWHRHLLLLLLLPAPISNNQAS